MRQKVGSLGYAVVLLNRMARKKYLYAIGKDNRFSIQAGLISQVHRHYDMYETILADWA